MSDINFSPITLIPMNDLVPPVVVEISANGNPSEEGPTPGSFTIDRGTEIEGDLTVFFEISALSFATLGVDYTLTDANGVSVVNGDSQGTVTILEGSSNVVLTLTPIADTDFFELDEDVHLSLLNGPGYSLGNNFEASLLIDEDSVPQLFGGIFASTDEDTTVTINVLNNVFLGDDSFANSPITIVEPSSGGTAVHGTATVNDGGTPNDPSDDRIEFTPAANYESLSGGEFGEVFYTITDSDGDVSEPASVLIDILPVNDAPTTSLVTLAAISEDSGARLITQAELLVNASDAEGDSITAANLAISAGNGSLVDNQDGTWSYSPALNDDSVVSFSYDITDGTATTTTGTASLDIMPVNDAPSLTGDLNATLAAGGSYVLLAENLGFTDVDDAAAGVTFSVSNLINGGVRVNGVSATSFTGEALLAGDVSFVHDGSATVAASFEVNVDDGDEDNSTPINSTFNLTVTDTNEAPTLLASMQLTKESYAANESLELTNFNTAFPNPGWVIDADGAGDVSIIDFQVKNLATGIITDVADVSAVDITAYGNWGNFDYQLALAGFDGGQYELLAVARDQAGNESLPWTDTFRINGDPPTLLASMQLTKDSYAANESLELINFNTAFPNPGWVIDADGAGDVAVIDFQVKNVTTGVITDVADVSAEDITAYGTWGNFDYELELAGFDGGEYELVAVARDQSGNESLPWTDTFRINGDPPTLFASMQLTKDSYAASESLELINFNTAFPLPGWVIDTDGAGDVAVIDFQVKNLDTGVITDVADISASDITAYGNWGNFDYQLELTNFEVGQYELSAVARDQSGNESLPWRDTFRISSAPTLLSSMQLTKESYTADESLKLLNLNTAFPLPGWVIDIDGAADVAVIDFQVKNVDTGIITDVADVLASDITTYGTWGNFDYEFALTSFGAGNYELSAIARDLAGNDSLPWSDSFTINSPL